MNVVLQTSWSGPRLIHRRERRERREDAEVKQHDCYCSVFSLRLLCALCVLCGESEVVKQPRIRRAVTKGLLWQTDFLQQRLKTWVRPGVVVICRINFDQWQTRGLFLVSFSKLANPSSFSPSAKRTIARDAGSTYSPLAFSFN